MCLSEVGRVTAVDPVRLAAMVEIDGRQTSVSTVALGLDAPDVVVGQWLLIHTGLAIERLAEPDARQILEARDELTARTEPGGRPT